MHDGVRLWKEVELQPCCAHTMDSSRAEAAMVALTIVGLAHQQTDNWRSLVKSKAEGEGNPEGECSVSRSYAGGYVSTSLIQTAPAAYDLAEKTVGR